MIKNHLNDTVDQTDPPPVPKKSPVHARTGISALLAVVGHPLTPIAVFVNYYLLVYNTVSALGWSYVLLLTLVHLFNLDSRGSGGSQSSASTLTRILSSLRLGSTTSHGFESRLPLVLQPLYRRAATTYARVGVQTAFIQSAAVLEVVHVLLGLVRSSLLTTGMQVSSRLFLVWGITEQFEVVSSDLRVLFHVLTRQFARLE